MSFNVFASADVFAAGDTNLDNFVCLNPREPCQTSFTNSIMQRLNIVQGRQGELTQNAWGARGDQDSHWNMIQNTQYKQIEYVSF